MVAYKAMMIYRFNISKLMQQTFWLIFLMSSSVAYANGIDALKTFLETSNIPSQVIAQFTANSEDDKTEFGRSIEFNGIVYGLYCFTPPSFDDLGAQAHANRVGLGIAEKKALDMLFLYAAGERYDKALFPNRNALVNALISWNKDNMKGHVDGRILPGLKTKSQHINGFSLAIAKIAEHSIEVYRGKLPEFDELQPLYFEELKAIAMTYIKKSQFNSAAPVFNEIIKFDSLDGVTALAAANCYLQTKNIPKSIKVLRFIHSHCLDAYTSEQAELAGELFLQADMPQEATDAFEMALARFKEEQATSSGRNAP